MPDAQPPVFLGVDLGWYGKPSGAAVVRSAAGETPHLCVVELARPAGTSELLQFIDAACLGARNAVIAVDAPLRIPNATGNREAEQQLNRAFRRYEAGCHPVNAAMLFAPAVIAFGLELADRGFRHEPDGVAQRQGRWQLEVYPHAAAVALFGLNKTIKYKRGLRATRAKELGRLRWLLAARLPQLDPPLTAGPIPSIPQRGGLKPVEDRLDAVLCAYMAAYWWRWGSQKCWIFGSNEGGAIVTPRLQPSPP